MSKQITPFQLLVVLLLSVGLSNHVLLLPSLLETGKRDAWICALLGYAYMLIWVFLLYFIQKRMNMSLAAWLKKQTNTFWRWLLTFPLIVYFFLTACITLYSTVMWAHASFIPRTPPSVIALALMILCYISAKSGLRSIAISGFILLPFVIIFGIYVSSVNFQYKDYSFLLPVFENSWGVVLKGSFYAASGLAEVIVLLTLQEELTKKVSLINLILLFIMLLDLALAPLTGAIAAFGPSEAELLRFPAYEQWRLASVGSNLSQTDFLSIFQWLSGAFVRIALSLYALMKLIWLNPSAKTQIKLLVLSFFVYIVCQVPVSDINYLRFISIYYPSSLILVATMTILYAAVSFIGKKKKGVANDEQAKRKQA